MRFKILAGVKKANHNNEAFSLKRLPCRAMQGPDRLALALVQQFLQERGYDGGEILSV